MKTDEIRSMFLQFFQEKNHIIRSGSSLIPKKDNTLLFTNAGMNQFKQIYLRCKKNNQPSLTTSQYCIRTGGKHDDFEKVGYKPYHHTLFEMLGNFSFGEYFKEKSIIYAWEFLTKKKWLNLSKEKIWVTYYYKDHETKNIWLNIIKISSTHLIEIYDKKNIKHNSDNFWKMGDSGPCGPCTEIFYDQRKNDKNIEKIKTQQEIKKNCVEIWNIVFMQFNQIQSNQLIKLPIPSVDTGMGLERIAAILQNVTSSFEIDHFAALIQDIKHTTKIKENNNISLRIMADHIRTSVCLISENIRPGNEGRNYVLRRIIRRALSHGYFIGLQNPFFYKLSEHIVHNMKKINDDFYIQDKLNFIKDIILSEEQQFSYTLKKGINKLKKELVKIKKNKLCEKKIFYLYDTLGLPLEITKDICKKKKISINVLKLNKIIKNNKKKQNIKKINKKKKKTNLIFITHKSIFDGYYEYKKTSKIIQIIYKNENNSKLSNKQAGVLVLDITPFYGESSGQIGDSGKIFHKNGIFTVTDTQKNGDFIAHIGFMKTGILNVNDIVIAKINKKKRKAIQSNHTATHLLHSALHKTLKSKITQKGSLINDQYLRFDFNYDKSITPEHIKNLEILINQIIQKNIPIYSIITSFKKAKKYKIVHLKSKKYNNIVRIIEIKNFSIELCRGTHHNNTGKIGCFKITSYNNIGNEIKRITAITGIPVIKNFHNEQKKEEKIKKIFNIKNQNIYQSIKKLSNQFNQIKKENKYLRKKNIIQIAKKLIKKSKNEKKIFFIIKSLSNIQHKNLKKISDFIQKKIKSVILILINKNNNITTFLISVTQNIINKINSLDIMKILFSQFKGKGGGKKNITEGKLEINKIKPKKIKELTIKIKKQIKKNLPI